MNYEIVETFGECFVREKATNQVIKSFKKKIEAKTLMRHLNLGGGFDGNTPTFFLKKIPNFHENSKNDY